MLYCIFKTILAGIYSTSKREVTKLGSCNEWTKGSYVGKQAAMTEQRDVMSIPSPQTYLVRAYGLAGLAEIRQPLAFFAVRAT